jgi:phosphoribosyl-AMP cyclohydrolase
MNPLEEGQGLTLDFTKLQKIAALDLEVVPVAVQDIDTGEVLVIAFVNEQALKRALETRTAVFWSTSRNELWEKGKTSGDTFELVEVRVNCEQNSLLFLVRPRGGGMCHTRGPDGRTRRSCFYRRLTSDGSRLEFVEP